jgi:hypothetical protein
MRRLGALDSFILAIFPIHFSSCVWGMQKLFLNLFVCNPFGIDLVRAHNVES